MNAARKDLRTSIVNAARTFFVIAAVGMGVSFPGPSCLSVRAAVPADDEADEVRRELDQILTQPAFRRLRDQTAPAETPAATPVEQPGWLKKLLKWLFDLFDSGAGNASRLGALWPILVYTTLAIVCSLIIWLVVRAINSFRQSGGSSDRHESRPEEGEAALPPGDLAADEYEKRADELAAQGRHREAIGQLVLGAMSRIERGRLIRFRRGLTHRDYLRALRGRQEPFQAFRAIVSIYEPLCFGRRPAASEQFQSALSAYGTAFATPLVLESSGA